MIDLVDSILIAQGGPDFEGLTSWEVE